MRQTEKVVVASMRLPESEKNCSAQRLLTTGLVLPEPIKKAVGIPKILAKFSVEDAKKSPKTPLPALHIARAKRAKKKGGGARACFQNKTFF
jgi:hypothetical protein